MIFKIVPTARRPLPLSLWGKMVQVPADGVLVSPLPAFLDSEAAGFKKRPQWRVHAVHGSDLPKTATLYTADGETTLASPELDKLAKSKDTDQPASSLLEDLQASFEADGVPEKEAEARSFALAVSLVHSPGDESLIARGRRQESERKRETSPAAQAHRQDRLIRTMMEQGAQNQQMVVQLLTALAPQLLGEDTKPERIKSGLFGNVPEEEQADGDPEAPTAAPKKKGSRS